MENLLDDLLTSEAWNLQKQRDELACTEKLAKLDDEWDRFREAISDARPAGPLRDHSQEHRPTPNRHRRSSPMTLTPKDRIDERCHRVVLAPDERKLKVAFDELQEHRGYLESVAADCLLSLLLAIRSA